MATFGKTTTGASNTLHNANRKVLSQATLTESALLTSMTVRCASNNTTQTKHWKGVIYADSAGAPDALLATTAEASYSSTTVTARTANFAGEALAAGTYWIGYIHDGNATTTVNIYRDSTASMAVAGVDTYSDGPTDPAGIMAALAGPIDAFVTYTPDTGSTAGQIKVYNGSSFVAKPAKVWNGSSWVTKHAKRWNGSSWTTTPY